jgi:aryl-alcohol dehydrogenase-like predicted oxidoreductase
MLRSVQLGLGLIGVGKPWGVAPHDIPSESEAISLLEFAYELGVRCFDTAPSYGDGVSEARLGRFLESLAGADRDALTVATKFGEHWNASGGQPYADHSRDALCRSLDQSLARLGRIDVLQLHKTNPSVLGSADLARAWEYAESMGIRRIGPSVSDLESARIAIADPRYSVMQLPYHASNPAFAPVIDEAAARGIWVAVNRPFAMGAIVADKVGAFRFILERPFAGVVLTGTSSREHLRENWDAFQLATAKPRAAY